MKRDIYQDITNQIVQQLEAGVCPWIKPWSAAHLDGRVVLPLRHNGTAYRGVNVIALWLQGCLKGYAAPRWMTFKQALDLGGAVRKGEKGSLTVFASSLTRQEENQTGEEATREIHYLKGYTVFNVEQIDGLPDAFYEKPAPRVETLPRIEHADHYFENTRARIVIGGDRAYYAQGSDHIQMPPLEAFKDSESYYATLAHESVHWTLHPSRLNRSFESKKRFDEGYAREELVAELGAAFLCADLALTPALRDDHASYLDHWLGILKADKRAIFTAASHAQRAADFLHALQPEPDVEESQAA
jgi:antirestriction protein ArdC